MAAVRAKRLAKDFAELQAAGMTMVPEPPQSELSLDCFCVVLDGPADTPYAGGRWRVRFTIPANFPFSSPSVGFVEHILHPNIDWSSGSVCLDSLNKKWSPVFTVKHIMDSLLPYLLAYPNPEDPLNREAAALLRSNPQAYAVKVAEAARKYRWA